MEYGLCVGNSHLEKKKVLLIKNNLLCIHSDHKNPFSVAQPAHLSFFLQARLASKAVVSVLW